MMRRIIKIDEDKCNGCGLCVSACHEGAIAMVDGKARLMRDDYCDGLGDCLPVCPTGAITFEQREAAEYDEAAVKAKAAKPEPLAFGCPGAHSRKLVHDEPTDLPEITTARHVGSQLNQWPVQIKLVPTNAPYFEGAHLLIAADCSAFACGSFHDDYMRKRITIIGCPKLDEGDYAEKLTAILKLNSVASVTVVRMEVPCCGGIENAAKTALKDCGKLIPWQVVVLSTDGKVIDR